MSTYRIMWYKTQVSSWGVILIWKMIHSILLDGTKMMKSFFVIWMRNIIFHELRRIKLKAFISMWVYWMRTNPKIYFPKQFQSLISFDSFVLLNNFQFENSSKNLMTLKRADLSTAGNYRCEVSTDAPTFHIITRGGALKVIGESYKSLNEMFIDQKHCKIFITSFLSLRPDNFIFSTTKTRPQDNRSTLSIWNWW